MKEKKFLSAFTLKLVAIIAMTIDHLAWGGVEFFTLPGQFMHIIGRLTIPIMCFFIVEGYHHTRNRGLYALRLLVFGLISILPFTLFFGEMYGHRQNYIFDLLLGLLVLHVVGEEAYSKVKKGILISLLFLVSLCFGGWPVLPQIYILIFYKFRGNFKKIALYFCGATVGTVAFISVASFLNGICHILPYDWVWYEKFYLLGFMLALPLLSLYNGEKGGDRITSILFYLYYPLHLLLFSIMFREMPSIQTIFIIAHVVAMALLILMILLAATSKGGELKAPVVLFLSMACIFMAGYLIELITPDVISIAAATKLEYFAQCGCIISFTWLISGLLRVRVPVWLYCFEGVISAVTIIGVFTMESNRWFYRSFSITTRGAFPIALVEPGPLYYLYYSYVGIMAILIMTVFFLRLRSAGRMERKRFYLVMLAIVSLFAFVILRVAGVSEYDMISFGTFAAVACVSYAALKYKLFGSAGIAVDTVLNLSGEGIIVVDMSGEITMINDRMRNIMPNLEKGKILSDLDGIRDIIQGKRTSLKVNDIIYEFRKEPVVEEGEVLGYMLWAIDMTQHFRTLDTIRDTASTDSLTGLYNRAYFTKTVSDMIEDSVSGSIFMVDMDMFKMVNDTYGHDVGDKVLVAFAEHIRRTVEDYPAVICRLGGDEFTLFIPDCTDECRMEELGVALCNNVKEAMKQEKLPEVVGASVGICIVKNRMTFQQAYKNADLALYESKESGKGKATIWREKEK